MGSFATTRARRRCTGVLLLDGRLAEPRGARALHDVEDEPRVADLTTRIAENVIRSYLSA